MWFIWRMISSILDNPVRCTGCDCDAGYVEEEPMKNVFLVCFEDKVLNLGCRIGCFSEDLTINQIQS